MTADWLRTLRRLAFARRSEIDDIAAELRREDARIMRLIRRQAEARRELADVEAAISEIERITTTKGADENKRSDDEN